MKRLKIAAAAVLLVAALAGLSGCVDRGTVVDKKYTPAHGGTMFLPVGKSVTILPTYYGDSWELKVEDGGETGWVTVDETTYHDYEIGDYYQPED